MEQGVSRNTLLMVTVVGKDTEVVESVGGWGKGWNGTVCGEVPSFRFVVVASADQ